MTETMASADATTTSSIPTASLHRALNNAMAFASTDKARPILASVLLERLEGDDELRIVATDSYALSLETLPTGDAIPVGFSLLVGVDDVKRLLPMLKAEGPSGVVTIAVDERVATFTTLVGSTSVTPTYGEFPKYRGLFPTPFQPEQEATPIIGLDAKILARFAKVTTAEAAASSKKPATNPVRFTMGETELKPVTFAMGESFSGLVMPVRKA